MRHIKLTIQYDGTAYHGWQRQKKRPTVQSVIEEKLSEILKTQIKVRGAGRTDAGVHALGQVATFKAPIKLSLQTLKKALNALLPKDIRVVSLEEVDENFHPQYDVKKKSYVYYVCTDKECSPFLQRYVWNYTWKVDYQLMKNALPLFIGTKDFSAVSESTEVKNKVRTVFDYTMEIFNEFFLLDIKFEGNFIKFRIEADGFLKYMVRNIVGCTLEIGRGRLMIEQLYEAIKKGVRPTPLQTAPAHGLFLEKIFY